MVIKVLHIIENFNGQAIERWLYQMMRCLKEAGEEVDWTFYAILGQAGKMDDSVRDIGGEIIYSPVPFKQKLHFMKALRGTLVTGGYDILHSHHDVLSAVYLLASTGLPLKRRILHVHNTALALPTPSLLKKALLHEPMRQACLHWADNVVGVSDAALDAFLKGKKHKPSRDLVIHCGIDMVPFHRKPPGRPEFLQSLGLPTASRVMLFVGRMTDYKNPCFVIDVLAHVSKLDPTVCAVFAGSGPLEEAVRKKAARNSLESRARVMGWQEDIPALMQSCDLLIWPGLEEPKEGLGLAVVEAQAAGLPVVMSQSVSEEAVVIPELVDVLPLADGPRVWADATVAALNRSRPDRCEARKRIEASSFSISRSASNIMALYQCGDNLHYSTPVEKLR
jgi:glycosyltransferase involved in cell wall biosynthesis